MMSKVCRLVPRPLRTQQPQLVRVFQARGLALQALYLPPKAPSVG